MAVTRPPITRVLRQLACRRVSAALHSRTLQPKSALEASMRKLSVSQLRSGEGWILSRFSNVGPEVLPDEMGDLLAGPLLVASEAFAGGAPMGGRELAPGLHAFEGEAARRMLREHSKWSGRGAIFACVSRVPDEDARRKWIPDPLRPWDCERLGASFYGQSGRRYAHRGLWFAREADRQRFVELAVGRVLRKAGVEMPIGDVTLVLEMPTDSTFEGVYSAAGHGRSFRMTRRFGDRGFVRTWRIVRGEWEAEDGQLASATNGRTFSQDLVQGAASAGIVLLSLPVFALVALLAVVGKLTGARTPTSAAPRPRALQ